MEHSARFEFFGSLAELIVRPHQAGRVIYHFNDQPAVKDAIEALGIPHTEVDAILAGQRSVGFDYPLQAADQLSVYPYAWPLPHACVIRLIPPVPDDPRFILDVHLGKLARRLRLLGFDCLYRNDYDDDQIVRIALGQDRIILTGDRGLLKRRQVVQGCLIRSGRAEVQLRQVIDRYDLIRHIRPLGRCSACNGLLQPVPKQEIVEQLQPKTRLYYQTFLRCENCGRIYWHGSHTGKILQWIERLRQGR